MELFIESSTICEIVASGATVYLTIVIVLSAGVSLCRVTSISYTNN
jgi:hypothetical protein